MKIQEHDTNAAIDSILGWDPAESPFLSSGSDPFGVFAPVPPSRPILEERRTLDHRTARLLAEVALQIEVSVGSIELSVEQLLDLRAGQSFHFLPDDIVVLSIGSLVIGEAKVILHGEQLMLQVVRLVGDENVSAVPPSAQRSSELCDNVGERAGNRQRAPEITPEITQLGAEPI